MNKAILTAPGEKRELRPKGGSIVPLPVTRVCDRFPDLVFIHLMI